MKIIRICIFIICCLVIYLPCAHSIPAKGTKLNVVEGALRNKLTQNTSKMDAQQYLRWNKGIPEYLFSLPQALYKDYTYWFALKRAALSHTTINQLYRHWSQQIANVLFQLQSRLAALHTQYRNAQPLQLTSFYKEVGDALKTLITPLIAELEASTHFVGNKSLPLPEYQNFTLALINLLNALDVNAIARYIQTQYTANLRSMPEAQAQSIASQGFNNYYNTAFKLYGSLLQIYGRENIENLFNHYQRPLPSEQPANPPFAQSPPISLPSERPIQAPSIPTQQSPEPISSEALEIVQLPPSPQPSVQPIIPTPPQSIGNVVPDTVIQPLKNELNALVGANPSLLSQAIPQQEGEPSISWQELFVLLLDNTNTQASQEVFNNQDMVETLMEDLTYAFFNPPSLVYEQLAYLAAKVLMTIAGYYQDGYDPLFITQLREMFNEPLKKGVQQGRINPRYTKI